MVLLQLKLMNALRPLKKRHLNDLLELFPNFDFEDGPFHDATPDVSGQSMY